MFVPRTTRPIAPIAVAAGSAAIVLAAVPIAFAVAPDGELANMVVALVVAALGTLASYLWAAHRPEEVSEPAAAAPGGAASSFTKLDRPRFVPERSSVEGHGLAALYHPMANG